MKRSALAVAPSPELRSNVPATDGIAIDGLRPLLPEGWYEARYTGHDTAMLFNSPKVILHFMIVQPGDWFENKLFRAYRASALLGKAGRGGRFKLHARSDLLMDLVRLNDLKVRRDRPSLEALKGRVFSIKVRTVTRNHRHIETPPDLYYSTIEQIVSA